MKWTFIPADPASPDDFLIQDRIRVDSFDGWESGLSYLSDVSTWYAEQNVRQGYDFRIEGYAFKGPKALDYRHVEFSFEPSPGIALLRAHLAVAWGPEGEDLPAVGDPDVVRITHIT